MLLFCCACFVARDICLFGAVGFVAFDLLFFICGFRAILRPQRPYVFYPCASPLLGGVLQFVRLVKVGLLGCRSYLALPSAANARSGASAASRRRPSLHSLRSFRCWSPSPPSPLRSDRLTAAAVRSFLALAPFGRSPWESGIFICAVCRWRGSAFFAHFA